MRSWPSWASVALGALLTILGLWESTRPTTLAGGMAASWGWLLLAGAVLLAAGLHSLQASYDSWCDCASCSDGCGCCGDNCSCGDCASCGPQGAGNGSAPHSH
ncbi:MAG: hypothetical protein ABR586_02560 [Thermoplasmatota archaeon]